MWTQIQNLGCFLSHFFFFFLRVWNYTYWKREKKDFVDFYVSFPWLLQIFFSNVMRIRPDPDPYHTDYKNNFCVQYVLRRALSISRETFGVESGMLQVGTKPQKKIFFLMAVLSRRGRVKGRSLKEKITLFLKT